MVLTGDRDVGPLFEVITNGFACCSLNSFFSLKQFDAHGSL